MIESFQTDSSIRPFSSANTRPARWFYLRVIAFTHNPHNQKDFLQTQRTWRKILANIRIFYEDTYRQFSSPRQGGARQPEGAEYTVRRCCRQHRRQRKFSGQD